MPASPGFNKRQKELGRQMRQKEKEQRRAQRRQEKATRPEGDKGEDPDIAGIVPGPQPLPEEDAEEKGG